MGLLLATGLTRVMLFWLVAGCSNGVPAASEPVSVGVLIRPQGASSPRYDMVLTMPPELEQAAVISALTGLVYVAAGACIDELRAPVTFVLSLNAGRVENVVGPTTESCLADHLRGVAREGLGLSRASIVLSLRPHDGGLDALAP